MDHNKDLVRLLKENKLTITTMESCTSGALISTITDIEGASSITEGGFVTYSNRAKIAMGVSSKTIDRYGVYSIETAVEMAHVCRKLNNADIGVGITGTLSNIDPANKDSIPGSVFYCIVYKDTDYTYQMNVPAEDRHVQKQIIVNDIINNLINLLSK